MKRALLNFTILFLGICIVMAGIASWVAVRDYDQHYYFESAYDEYPSDKGELGYYSELPPRQQRIVRNAIDGRTYQFDDGEVVPPPVVRYEDEYYVFVYFKTFDWSDPGVFLSTLTILAGFLMTVEGIRREQFPHVWYTDFPVLRRVNWSRLDWRN